MSTVGRQSNDGIKVGRGVPPPPGDLSPSAVGSTNYTGVLRAPNTENVCTHNDVMEMCVSAPNIALSLQNENGNQKLALALGV